MIYLFCLLNNGINVHIPKLSGKILAAFIYWNKNNFRPVVILVFTGFGLFFLIKGISGLIT